MTGIQNITAPVGAYPRAKTASPAHNLPADLKTVASLLKVIPEAERGFGPVPLPFAGRTFSRAIERFQEVQFGVGCGRMEPDNVTIARLSRLAAKHNGGDPSEVNGPVTFSRDMMVAMHAHFVARLRDAMVARAAKHVGQVNAGTGGHGSGGQKHGAELLWRIHSETLAPASQIERAKVVAAGKKPVSWCGIYALWCTIHAMRKMGSTVRLEWHLGKGIYRGGLKMEPISISKPEQLGKGDICVVNETSNGVWINHHVIVAEDRPGARFKTIEGNYWDPVKRINQSIVRNERGIGEIMQAYRIADFIDPVAM